MLSFVLLAAIVKPALGWANCNSTFPFLLMIQNYAQNVHMCSATMISSYWVLTAGHCCQDIIDASGLPNFFVTGGFNCGEQCIYEQNTNIEKMFLHPQYSQEDGYQYDVCMIRVRKPIRITVNVDQVVFKTEDALSMMVEEGFDGVVGVSYQVPSTEGPSGSVIKEIRCMHGTVPPRNQCLGADESTFCVDHDDVVACYGDSGGPYLVDDHQVGIQSYLDTPDCESRKVKKAVRLDGSIREFIRSPDNETLVNLRVGCEKLKTNWIVYHFVALVFIIKHFFGVLLVFIVSEKFQN